MSPAGGPEAARAAAERAAREGYGRLLALLAWQWRDIAAAEDALAEAFATALARWPADGVPERPEAWLLTVARRRLGMAARHDALGADPTLTVLWPAETTVAPEAEPWPDARLRLLFVCAHPAIEASVRPALMLQTVLGLGADRIASAFLVKPEAMTKRLVRAKAKIRATGLRFEVPGHDEWPERLGAVLDAIYGAYTLHYDHADADAASGLADEAVYLAALVAAQAQDDPEALGLLALLRFCEARRPARIDAAGVFVPLDEQDVSRWDAGALDEAQALLLRAAAATDPGPYQIEAAIQCAHMAGRRRGRVPWGDIAALHERLLQDWPTLGGRIAHAVARARADEDPAGGLARLQALDRARVVAHPPWWAARAHLLERLGDHAAAAAAVDRALALTADPAVHAWLSRRRAALDPACGAR